MFSKHSDDVIGFDSTWKHSNSEKLTSTATETDSMASTTTNAESSTNPRKDAEIQTEQPGIVRLNEPDEQRLAEWLRRIYPQVERELGGGPTVVFEFNDTGSDQRLNGTFSGIIPFSENQNLIFGTAAWMSINIENAPILAVSASESHESWCVHNDAHVKFYRPKRCKGVIQYEEFKSFPITSCVQALSTNSFNKDMIAAGTIAGDLYIWQYENNSDGGTIVELCTENTLESCIVDVCWMKSNPAVSDFEILTCHKDGLVLMWRIGQTIIKDKIFMINSQSIILGLTTILGISAKDFLVGTDNGKVILCSTSKAVQIADGSKQFNPIIAELESHKFAVSTMIRKKNTKSNETIITCDMSGEIYFRNFDNLNGPAENIVKIPLPFKEHVVSNPDVDHLLAAGSGGALDIFNIESGTVTSIAGSERDNGNMIVISDNGEWIITGCYKGHFQLFQL